jgi:tetratricopeptide (TPR) repeat protein
MLSFTGRIVIATIGIIASIYFLVNGNWVTSAILLTLSVFQIVGIFLNGTVFLALRKLAQNDFVSAESVLRKTKYPKYLAKTPKAYYFLIAGLIEAQKRNFQIAAAQLEQAMEIGLRTKNDRAVASLNLAGIYFNLGNKDKAVKYLDFAKENDPAPALQPRVDELEAALGISGHKHS